MKDLSHFRPIYIMSPGKIAGAEKVVLTGLLALKKIELNPLIIIVREDRAPLLTEDFIAALDPSIEYRIVNSKKAIDWNLTREIKNILNEFKNDPFIIHTHGFKALVTTKLTFSGHPHIHTHHGNTGHTFKVKCYEAFAYLVMRFCSHVIAVSKKMEELLLIELYPKKNISTIDNMLSINNAAEIAQKRSTSDINPHSIKLIFIGRISPEKGLADFINAWALASNKNDFFLTILGDGPDKLKCERLVNSKGLNANCNFVGFTKTPADYLAKNDLLIMPSHTEGLPMTLIEAASCGLPILGNDVGALSQVVKSGDNGQLITLNQEIDKSALKWKKALEETPHNISIWKTSAQAQASSFQKQFSSQTWAVKTKELYLKYL